MKSRREHIEFWFNELKKIVLSNIDSDKYAIFLFGPAVNRDSNFEDIDIGVIGNEPVTIECLSNITQKIDESVFPYRFTIMDFSTVSETFKSRVYSSKIEIWNRPTSDHAFLQLRNALYDMETSLNIDLSAFDVYVRDMLREGQVQKFQFSFEVLWKTIKTYLRRFHGIVVSSPKQSIKEIFNERIIDEETYDSLYRMFEDSNFIINTSSQKKFEAVHKKLPDYLFCLKKVLRILENIK